jgi:acetylornithine deacetylase
VRSRAIADKSRSGRSTIGPFSLSDWISTLVVVQDLVVDAVRRRQPDLIQLAQRLVRVPSVLGAEEPAQRIVAEVLAALGFTVERISVPDGIAETDVLAGYPPLRYEGRTNVAARLRGTAGDKSLHLSGHIDVVPSDDADCWTYDPWAATLANGRLHGRGAGDMKGGLAAYLIAVAAFLEACPSFRGEILFSSVIEEECTGNGMKAVLDAGYDGDATLIGEPSGLRLQHAGVGVIWAQLQARSSGAHPAFATGESAPFRLLNALNSLRRLEATLNQRQHDADRLFFNAFDRPFRLNIGRLGGGTWPSSEPVAVSAGVRLGFGLSLSPRQAQASLLAAVNDAAAGVDVTFEGFRAPAYVHSPDDFLAQELRSVHSSIHGEEPETRVLAGTTDARSVPGPCLCYGPIAGGLHAVDEWVDVASLIATAEAVALTLKRWLT